MIGVEWYPSNSPGIGTDGGSIYFGRPAYNENPFDLHYNLNAGAYAPTSIGNNAISAPMASGMWRWKISWVGEPGEPAPLDVLATVQGGGSVTVNTGAGTHYTGLTVSSNAATNDPFLNAACGSIDDWTNFSNSDSDTDSDSVVDTRYGGASGFVHISGTTYHGWVNYNVASQASLEAYGSRQRVGSLYVPNGIASATVNLAMRIRLTHVAGQRVQPDL